MTSKQKDVEVTGQPSTPRAPEYNALRFVIKYIAPVLLACLTGLLFRYVNSSSSTPAIATIPVSLVLKQNFRLAKRSWEHGVLTHALLELQNPELTVFAGPGYGFDLHGPANLDAFPGGNLPKCASEDGGSSWGRYDKWTNVKGLRYAAEKVDLEGKWLYNDGGSPVDAASLGWATLLLERAGATDPVVPVEARRNLFGESADRMARWLVEESPKFIVGKNDDGDEYEQNETVPLRKIGHMSGRKWAISHQAGSKQLWADSVFMVPPFLAAYAVARQNETWLREAVEQIQAYHEVLARPVSDSGKWGSEGELWKHIISQPRSLGEEVCCHDEEYWLTGNAWALAGMVRVYGVLDRWGQSAEPSARREQQKEMQTTLKRAARAIMLALSSRASEHDGFLRNYMIPGDIEYLQWMFEDAAGTALIASSIYRSAQLALLGTDQGALLRWADNMYNAVALKINRKGLLEDVTTVSEVPAKHAVVGTSESQSFVLMMFAARRDCVRLNICT